MLSTIDQIHNEDGVSDQNLRNLRLLFLVKLLIEDEQLRGLYSNENAKLEPSKPTLFKDMKKMRKQSSQDSLMSSAQDNVVDAFTSRSKLTVVDNLKNDDSARNEVIIDEHISLEAADSGEPIFEEKPAGLMSEPNPKSTLEDKTVELV